MHIFGNLHPSFTLGFYSGEITETESFSFIANLKINYFYFTSGKFTKNNHSCGSVYSMVYLSVCCGELCLQICLSVCWLEIVFAIGFVCLLVCGHVITFFLPLGMVSAFDCFITELKLSQLQMGRLLAILGVHLSIFFYVAFFCYVYYHGLFVSCLGWCGCWAFFFCFVISICTELLCFGRGILTTCI